MSGHEIIKCARCDSVIAQCRCPGPHTVRYTSLGCENCNGTENVPPPPVEVVGLKQLVAPVLHPFDYRVPSADEREIMEKLTVSFKLVYEQIQASVAPSAEKTLALRKLQESRMWVNVAILEITLPRNGDTRDHQR